MDTLHDLLSPSNGFVAIAFIVASWALRRFVKTVDDLARIVDRLKEDHSARLTALEFATGIRTPARRGPIPPPDSGEPHD